MMLSDYLEKPKKKKKEKDRSEKPDGIKQKPIRNFRIIDDDIDLRTLNANDEGDMLADLLDPEGPMVVTDVNIDKTTSIKSEEKRKWKSVSLSDEKFDEFAAKHENDDDEQNHEKGMFKKRHEKPISKMIEQNDDQDLDDLPRRRVDSDQDLSPVRRRSPSLKEPRKRADNDGDISPVRRKNATELKEEKEEEVDYTKVRRRKLTQEEELKKIKQKEKMEKYKEWGKGLVQKKQKEEKLEEFIHEVNKPMARYASDVDLESMLKKQDREEDPMLQYIKSKRDEGDERQEGEQAEKKAKTVYRGPPAPPNRYNILPGPRWDGVDRSNGFEKRYFESITAKKARQEEAYKWSIEDM